jgi:hypothetical protein
MWESAEIGRKSIGVLSLSAYMMGQAGSFVAGQVAYRPMVASAGI